MKTATEPNWSDLENLDDADFANHLANIKGDWSDVSLEMVRIYGAMFGFDCTDCWPAEVISWACFKSATQTMNKFARLLGVSGSSILETFDKIDGMTLPEFIAECKRVDEFEGWNADVDA